MDCCRVAQLRAEGRIRAKARARARESAEKHADLRSISNIGRAPIEGAQGPACRGSIVAGNTVVVEPQTMIEAADAAGLFVTGVPA